MKVRSNVIEALVLCAVPIIVTLLVYSKLPETIAVHFNFAFKPDSFAPKWMLFVISGFCFLIEAVICICIKFKKFGAEQNPRILRILLWFIPVLSCTIQFVLLFYTLQRSSTAVHLIPFIIGIGFIILGNSAPKMKPNAFMGIRTPWSLKNRDNWNKTNRLFAKLLVLLGIILTVASFVTIPSTFLIISFILVLLIPTVYSYQLHRAKK